MGRRPPRLPVPPPRLEINWDVAKAIANAGVSAEEAGQAFADLGRLLDTPPENPSPSACPHCGDELPAGAAFCIACGRPAPVTGKTRRLR